MKLPLRIKHCDCQMSCKHFFVKDADDTSLTAASWVSLADARLIVSAVNSHKKLLEACDEALNLIELMPSVMANTINGYRVQELLKAALAIAKEQG